MKSQGRPPKKKKTDKGKKVNLSISHDLSAKTFSEDCQKVQIYQFKRENMKCPLASKAPSLLRVDK